MRFDDVIIGLVLMAFGLSMILVSADFEPLRHITYGPGFFPSLIGGGFVVCGGGLVVRRLVRGGKGQWVELGAWRGSPRHIVGFALIPVSVLLYVIFSKNLGFLLAMFILLAVLLTWFTRRVASSLIISLLVTVGLQAFFQGFMGVPLPWGLLEPYSGGLTWL